MKAKTFFITCLLLLQKTVCYSQTVSIPDPLLKACLEKKYASCLDSSKNLILSEAAKIGGTLSCGSQTIKNAEGVQYFTGIDNLNISYNTLKFVPDLSPLRKIQVLDVSDNQIAEFQDLQVFTDLRDLDLKNNKLSKFPDVSKNMKLEVLSAPGNFFDSIPDLSALTRLRLLYVENNQIKKLPDLKNLTALTNINCSNNNLGSLVPLSSLKMLSSIDVSGNHLTNMPTLPPGPTLKTLIFTQNELTSLPDFSVFDSLKTVALQYNNLSFKNLLPLTKRNNYTNIYQVIPQDRKMVGTILSIPEGDPLVLRTGIDADVPQVSYEWFFNGVSLGKISGDSIVISQASSSVNTGFYFARLSHPLFAGLILETDSFAVNVRACLNPGDFSTVVTGITCENAGALKIQSASHINQTLSYTLTGLQTGKKMTSSLGAFTQLTEPAYKLTIMAGSNCTKVYADSLIIPIEHCDAPFITPDGDGVNDTYFFTGKGKAIISDKWGNQVHTLRLPEEWNGSNSEGRVAPGLYFVNINDGEKLVKITVVY